MIFTILQIFGGVILSVGYVPQIRQILRTKRADGLNVNMFLSMCLGLACMEAYAIKLALDGVGYGLLITNTLGLFLASVLTFLIYKYQNKEKINLLESVS